MLNTRYLLQCGDFAFLPPLLLYELLPTVPQVPGISEVASVTQA